MNWIVKNIPMAGATVVMLCMSTPGRRSAAGWRPVSAASGVPLAEPIGGPAAGVSDMCGSSLSGLSLLRTGCPASIGSSVWPKNIPSCCTYMQGPGPRRPRPMADDAQATLRIVMEEIPDSHLVAALARDFEREHAGFDVQVDIMYYDFMLDLILGSIGESGPPNGIVIFDNPWTSDFSRGGLLRPIDDLLADTPELD